MNHQYPNAVLFVALLVCAAAAHAQFLTTRYVSVSGFDTNNSCTFQAQPCRTIQHAINVANDGDTIAIFDGTYTQPLAVGKSLSFTRATDGTRPVIEAATQPGGVNARTVFILGPATVSFSGLRIRHGRASGSQNGGGILCINRCVLNLSNMFVNSNSAGGEGGGIYITGSDGTSTFTNAVIENNEAGTHGGGIRISNSNLNLEDSVRIRGNEAGGVGGGISLTGGLARFRNVTIGGSAAGEANLAASHGGGIRVTVTNLIIRDSRITGNQSGDRGGGVESNGCFCQFIDTNISRNHAAVSGGGLYHRPGDSVLLTRVGFTTNSAISNGGGMVALGRAQLREVVFQENWAGNNGAAFWNNNDETFLEDVTFSDCVTGFGCMYNTESSPELFDVRFTENEGVGMVNEQNSGPLLVRTTFDRNSSNGMANINSSPRLQNVTFSNNGLRGMENVNSSPIIVNGAFWKNGLQTVGDGAGIFNLGSFLLCLNCSITQNMGSQGGGIANFGSQCQLFNSIVWGNTAAENNGGNEIYNNFGSISELKYSLYGDSEGDIVSDGDFSAENSLNDDPRFVDAENGNLHLQGISPAIDAGDPRTGIAIFPTDGNGDPIDLDGNPRFVNTIDIGAYEFLDNIFADRFKQQ